MSVGRVQTAGACRPLSPKLWSIRPVLRHGAGQGLFVVNLSAVLITNGPRFPLTPISIMRRIEGPRPTIASGRHNRLFRHRVSLM
jgi:hypothetical protein